MSLALHPGYQARRRIGQKDVDGRDKPGHDECGRDALIAAESGHSRLS
jgi:hypothetical protein